MRSTMSWSATGCVSTQAPRSTHRPRLAGETKSLMRRWAKVAAGAPLEIPGIGLVPLVNETSFAFGQDFDGSSRGARGPDSPVGYLVLQFVRSLEARCPGDVTQRPSAVSCGESRGIGIDGEQMTQGARRHRGPDAQSGSSMTVFAPRFPTSTDSFRPSAGCSASTATFERVRLTSLVAHPEHGFLVIEVKAGEIRRDANGWWAGGRRLPRSPFEQASDSQHSLVRKLRELPDWHPDLVPIAGHAVAFPDVDLRSAGARLGLLGPDVDAGLILDQPRLLDTADRRRARVARCRIRRMGRWRHDEAARGEREFASSSSC